MEVLHRRETTVAEVSEVDGAEAAVADFAFGIEVVGGEG